MVGISIGGLFTRSSTPMASPTVIQIAGELSIRRMTHAVPVKLSVKENYRMHPMFSGSLRYGIVAALLVVSSGFARVSEARQLAKPFNIATVSVSDTSLFAAVVQAVGRSPDSPLHVDPRPLNGSATVLEPSVEALATLAPVALRSRKMALQRMGIPETDAIADMQCATGNMRVQIDSAGASQREARGVCEGRQPILSVIASLPFAAAPDGEAGGGASGQWVVRVFEISVSPRFGSYAAVDYRFVRDPATGGWRLVRKNPVYFAG